MKVLALVLLVICSGCTTAFRPPDVRPVEVVTIEKPAPMYHPPLPPRIKSMPVEWKILTPDTMEEYLDDLKAGEAPVNAWYSLTTKGYENISNNMAQIHRYIKQVLSIVEYYLDVDAERQKQDAEPPIEE